MRAPRIRCGCRRPSRDPDGKISTARCVQDDPARTSRPARTARSPALRASTTCRCRAAPRMGGVGGDADREGADPVVGAQRLQPSLVGDASEARVDRRALPATHERLDVRERSDRCASASRPTGCPRAVAVGPLGLPRPAGNFHRPRHRTRTPLVLTALRVAREGARLLVRAEALPRRRFGRDRERLAASRDAAGAGAAVASRGSGDPCRQRPRYGLVEFAGQATFLCVG